MKTEQTDLNQCPRYDYCRTSRDLPPEFCARYRCNTFHQIDTIKIHNVIYAYLGSRNGHGGNQPIEKDISEIVQRTISEMSSN